MSKGKYRYLLIDGGDNNAIVFEHDMLTRMFGFIAFAETNGEPYDTGRILQILQRDELAYDESKRYVLLFTIVKMKD